MHRPPRARRTPIAARLLTAALAWALVAGGTPPWSLLGPVTGGRDAQAVAAADATPPAPQTLTAPPYQNPHLPALSVRVAVDPDPVAVGQAATITVTVTNGAADPATGLSILLPVPAGVAAATPTTPLPASLAQRAAALGLPTTGWTWAPTLGGNASVTVTATATVAQMPAGGALLLTPTVGAQGLAQPIQTTGGAIVVDPAEGGTQRFSPGAGTTLASASGAVRVAVPGGAAGKGLTLRHALAPASGEAAAPAVPGFRKGLGTFYLSATDDAGAAVHAFAQPLTLTVAYTPEQLRARGIAEGDLALFWYDPDAKWRQPDGTGKQGLWTRIETAIDPVHHTASASVAHFSAFHLTDGSSPSTAYLPTVEGWGVSQFTGSATDSLPIAAPAGPAGIRPDLALTYSSDATNGPKGERPNLQSGWVGKGWNLDVPSIDLRMVDFGLPSHYTLAIGGKSFALVRGQLIDPVHGDPTDLATLTNWHWSTSDESYLRVVPIPATGTIANRGGTHNGVAYPRYEWRVWAKDGTRYEFAEDQWWGWTSCGGSGTGDYMETYRWQISRVVDTHGNAITYHYDPTSTTRPRAPPRRWGRPARGSPGRWTST